MYRTCEAHYLSDGSPCPACEIERLERIAAEKIGELVTALRILPPGEDAVANFDQVIDAARRLQARVEELTRWRCPECGPQEFTDEDACCKLCGRDCYDPLTAHRINTGAIDAAWEMAESLRAEFPKIADAILDTLELFDIFRCEACGGEGVFSFAMGEKLDPPRPCPDCAKFTGHGWTIGGEDG